MKTVTATLDEYRDWRAKAPWGPLGPLGEAPVFLIPTSDVRARATRRPPVPRALARPTKPLTFAKLAPAITTPPAPPKKCAACGTLVATPWLLWNVCKCGRVRPPTPREEAAQRRLRLAAAGA